MNQTLNIRKENPSDHNWVIELTEKAFETLEISDHNEGKLVDKLRKAPTFIEELSLVAELNFLVQIKFEAIISHLRESHLISDLIFIST